MLDSHSFSQRELHEELGLRSSQWRSLGAYTTSANRGGGVVHAFFADMCQPSDRGVDPAHRGDAEKQSALRLHRTELEHALLAGRFAEVKWTATIAIALLKLRRNAEMRTEGNGNHASL